MISSQNWVYSRPAKYRTLLHFTRISLQLKTFWDSETNYWQVGKTTSGEYSRCKSISNLSLSPISWSLQVVSPKLIHNTGQQCLFLYQGKMLTLVPSCQILSMFLNAVKNVLHFRSYFWIQRAKVEHFYRNNIGHQMLFSLLKRRVDLFRIPEVFNLA